MTSSNINFNAITTPIIHQGTPTIGYRDPAAHYHDGVFRVFHTLCTREGDSYYWHLAVTESRDLVKWSEPKILTEKNLSLNYSSPGNIIWYDGQWVLCLQTYPTPRQETTGDQSSRLWTMTSSDLVNWSAPKMMMVKGPDVPVAEMGRMIDPYLVQDMDNPEKWWCFYKQNGASISYSTDLDTWTYFGRVGAGENACVLVDGDEYVLIHSPKNGIGMKRSTDLQTWRDVAFYTLGQAEWIWAQGRITAGHVLDLRDEPTVGKYLMFFHGSVDVSTCDLPETHGAASLGIAWSDDLVDWTWPV
ncbi:MAG: hypothetical protein AAF639_26395 [Chloroflexota bacterium]